MTRRTFIDVFLARARSGLGPGSSMFQAQATLVAFLVILSSVLCLLSFVLFFLESVSVFNPPSSHPHDGRILRLDLTISTQEVSLLAIYAPAQPEDRDDFFSSTLLPILPPPSASLLIFLRFLEL